MWWIGHARANGDIARNFVVDQEETLCGHNCVATLFELVFKIGGGRSFGKCFAFAGKIGIMESVLLNV